MSNDPRDAPATATEVPLEAGPLSCVLVDGDVRSIRLGGAEVVNRIYFAVRDHDWATLPCRRSDEQRTTFPGGFRVRYHAVHRTPDAGFEWDAEITGRTGVLRFAAEGIVTHAFRRNRIGLCVLHPASAAGHRVTVVHPDGRTDETAFPRLVSPHQPFLAIAALHHRLPGGSAIQLSFEGDVFETEDQRNWTDASYKTYSTPLTQPFPLAVPVGTRVSQVVTVAVTAAPDAPRAAPARRPPALDPARAGPPARLPSLGLDLGPMEEPWTEAEVAAVRPLAPAHLRLELRAADPEATARLARGAAVARALGAPLAVALRVRDDEPPDGIHLLAGRLGSLGPAVAWVAALSDDAKVTTAAAADRIREALAGAGSTAPVGGGSRAYFAELNRSRPPPGLLDFLCWPMNPQVHAPDDRSILETPEGQAATVETARAFAPGVPLHVGPVTLRPQWNPDATGPASPPAPGALPGAVDPRQREPLAAAWLASGLARLAVAGAAAVTWYEALGWKGVVEREAGSPLPDRFPSAPLERFPAHAVLAALAPFAGGELRLLEAPDGLDAFTVTSPGGGTRLFVVSRSAAPRRWALGDGVERILPPHQVTWLDLEEQRSGR